MNATDFNSFLAGKISADKFRVLIDPEVANYLTLISKKGTTIDLRFLENERIYLDSFKFKALLNSIIIGELSNVHLAYICDCFSLADNVTFETDQIKEFVFELANPEINGGFKKTNELAVIASKIT
jgi:hypothetical protein